MSGSNRLDFFKQKHYSDFKQVGLLMLTEGA